MSNQEKLDKYFELHRQAVDDYCSHWDSTPRTRSGLRRMIKYNNKIVKLRKKMGFE